MKILIKKEFEIITPDEIENHRYFSELHSFALTEKGRDVLTAGHEYMKTRNYVGVIQTRSGFVLEILPKIHEDYTDIEKTRKTFIRMLKTLRHAPSHKKLQMANLRSEKMPLLEIFIEMFLDEVHAIIRKGIKSNYINIEENLYCMKGKLVPGEHVRTNIVHRERFFVSYDEYMEDIPKNRIIKAALTFCKRHTRWSKNQQRIHELLFVFDRVSIALFPMSEYNKIIYDRTSDYYTVALEWAMIFLGGRSFASYTGNTIAFALLFPMNVVFENYVYHCLKTYTSLKDLTYQSTLYYLAKENENPIFMIKPDMTALSAEENKCLILDAKWKVLDEENREEKYGISQGDLYQMLSYAEVYRKEKEIDVQLYLFYPKTPALNKHKALIYNVVSGTPLHVIPFDIEASINGDLSFINFEKT